MSLQKQTITIPVGGGLDVKTDPKLVPPGQGVATTLENGYMHRTGEIRKRPGVTAFSASTVNGSSLSQEAWRLAEYRGSLVNLLRQGASPIAVWSETNGKWIDISTSRDTLLSKSAGPVTHEVTSLLGEQHDGGNVYRCTAAYHNGYTCVVTPSSTSPVLTVIVLDSSGKRVTHYQAPDVPSGSPKVEVANGYFVVIWHDAAANDLKAITWQTSNPTGAPTSYTLSAGDVSVLLDTMTFSNRVSIVIRTTAPAIKLLDMTPATGAVTTAAPAVDVGSPMSWVADHGGNGSRHLVVANSAAGLVVYRLNAAMALTATYVIDAALTSGVNSVIGYTTSSSTGALAVIYDITATPAYNDRIKYSDRTAAGVVTTVDWLRSLSLKSKTFSQGGKVFFVATYQSLAISPAIYGGQNSYFLVMVPTDVLGTGGFNPTRVMSSKFLRWLGTGRVSAVNALTSVYSTATNEWVMALESINRNDAVAQGTARTEFSVNLVSLTFNPDEVGVPVEANGALHVPGGLLSAFDGVRLAESTIDVYPEQPTLTPGAGAGTVANGTYNYICVYAHTNHLGQKHRSAPSVATQVVVSGANNQVQVVVPSLRFTSWDTNYGPPPTVEIYRTAASGTTYYKLREIATNTSANTVSFTDTTADATLLGGELLYTTGNVLENQAPPSFAVIAHYRDRIFGISADNRKELWYSKPLQPLRGPEFNEALVIDLAEDGTALAVIDDKLIIFCENNIYGLVGDGPNDLGQGLYGAPEAVVTGDGTAHPLSVAVTPLGVTYRGKKGISILTRGLQAEYIGGQVQDWESQEIRAAVHRPTKMRVHFPMSSGDELVWDYQHKIWSTWTGRVDPLAACDWNGTYVYARAGNSVYREDEGVFTEAAVAYALSIQFPWWSLAGLAGFKRVYRIQVIGEYVGAHTLTGTLWLDYDDVNFVESRSRAMTTGPYVIELRPARQKCSSLRLSLSDGSAANAALRLSAICIEVGAKPGLGRVPSSYRMT